jgi:2-oxoglutarate dehydrogenase E2 component (dihydrolipoamide succinyltransferase)
LVVPVLRNVEGMSFADVEKAIAALAKKARDGQIAIEVKCGCNHNVSNGANGGKGSGE